MEWVLAHFDELGGALLYEILKLRVDVFVVEQNCPYPEVDGKDPHCWHLYQKIDGEIAAYARLLPPGISYKEASIGRVIVNEKFRGMRLGDSLIETAIQEAKKLFPGENIKIGAQARLHGFYSRAGFKSVSVPYDEDGILHIDMLLAH
ncbi:MAG: GNAT family N-acetyltransferase [Turicibacter sp.]|nr:GNAT family N-acetyltransferase [Turicibacter sp.]